MPDKSHLRRYFFEAAICKYPVGAVGLMHIREVFAADAALRDMPPIDRKRERERTVAPLVDALTDPLVCFLHGESMATRFV
ncbi:MAG: hypothetical protein WKG00_35045 [Polyangiaceae bacterium]